MSEFWTDRARLLRRLWWCRVAAALLGLAAACPLLAAMPPERPGATLWPAFDQLDLLTQSAGAAPRVRPGLVQEWVAREGPLDAGNGGRFLSGSLSQQLLGQMKREALRYQSSHLVDASGPGDPIDSVAESLRAQEAQTIVTRAFNRTLEGQIETLTRRSSRLRAAIDWVEQIGSSRHQSPGVEERGAEARLDAALGRAGAGGTSVGLSVGAHPRLILSTRFFKVNGRIELPLLDEPVRLGLERSIGVRSRAVFLSSLGGRQDWAAIGLSLSF